MTLPILPEIAVPWPLWRIEANSFDVTAAVQGAFKSMTLTDNLQGADTLSLALCDNLQGWIPTRGQKLTVYAGYDTTHKLGTFIIDEAEEDCVTGEITVAAKSAELANPLATAKKKRTWKLTTLRLMAGQLAYEHKLALRYDAKAAVLLDHEAQKDESDLSFLARVCKAHGAYVSVKNGTLCIHPGTGEGAPTIKVYKKDIAKGTKIKVLGESPKSVESSYWDYAKGKLVKIIEGEGTPKITIPRQADQARAIGAVKTAAKNAKLTTYSGSVKFARGRVDVRAGVNIVPVDFSRFAKGRKLLVSKVTHTFSESTFSTQVSMGHTN